MAVVLAMVLVGLVVVGVVVSLGLRTWTLGQARTEARLLSPDTHTVGYVVPEGQDPAVLMAAVTTAGYTAIVDTSGGTERLLVECDEHARGDVRRVLEGVHSTAWDGSDSRVEHIVFDDE